jgi:hypothetical protein
MNFARVVTAEVLDSLPASAPSAQRSRRDLRRIHRVLRTRTIVLRALRTLSPRHPVVRPLRILELGAGDGSLMLSVARATVGMWPSVELTLLDRQSLVDDAAVADYRGLDWIVTRRVADVWDWASDADPSETPWDVICANLFLHHFDGASLAKLLGVIASRTDGFLACEPSRRPVALAGSRLVGLLGVNAVTRGDAVLSVQAGFRGDELSTLWAAATGDWRVHEYGAGLFTHCLCAQRVGSN